MTFRTAITPPRLPDRRGTIRRSWLSLRSGLAGAFALAIVTGAAQAQRAQPAQNQGPPNALQGFSQNRDQPVKIQADSLVVRDKDKRAIFTGNVHVTQGDTELQQQGPGRILRGGRQGRTGRRARNDGGPVPGSPAASSRFGGSRRAAASW